MSNDEAWMFFIAGVVVGAFFGWFGTSLPEHNAESMCSKQFGKETDAFRVCVRDKLYPVSP